MAVGPEGGEEEGLISDSTVSERDFDFVNKLAILGLESDLAIE
jgi:hypothetical protein